MLYFVEEVLPKIRERMGDVPLYMLGSSITEKITALASPSVHAIGFVEDPEPWFAKARVFVAPLRYGAGMKGKIGQSLSLGLPIVTTSIGSEGMGLEADKHVLIADDTDAFADAVVRLYQDEMLWQHLADNGKAHVGQHFSQDAAGKALDRLIAMTGLSA
jgi:glycosyltransferase involved in cell wall biosynthesis